MGNQKAALITYQNAITLDPSWSPAYSNLGNALRDLKQLGPAVGTYLRALRITPHFSEAYSNVGNIFEDQGQLSKAIDFHGKALQLNPNFSAAYYNRGVALHALKKFDDALSSYNKAIRISPESAKIHWNKSLLLILTGDFKKGWELYEWRWKKRDTKKDHRAYPNPLTPNAMPPKGSLCFLYPEQGLGDTIQFCRYAKRLLELGLDVVMEVQPSLRSVASSLDSRIKVISSGEPVPNFDYQSSLMSLPWVLKTTLDSIPAEPAYLSISDRKRKEWVLRLGKRDKPRIGLVWSGNSNHKNDQSRSLGLDEIVSILSPAFEWHSLQKEYRNHDLPLLGQHSELHQHHTLIDDFEDTGALIEQMDLVISVDTSVAHLAGALGKQVWVLLPHVPDYRWMMDRKDSPWYPSAELYRQDETRKWGGVIARIQSDLVKKEMELALQDNIIESK
jgi:tetratricopeptide (TPR) repeat protein